MFCDSCGATLQPGQGYCVRCGKQVIGPVVAGSGRVARHAHMLGVLWIAYSAFSLLCGMGLIVVSHFLRFRFGGIPGRAPFFMLPLLSFIALLLFAKGLCGIAAGVGLLQRQTWARMLAIILGVISLFNMPFGTALGIYTLWVLISPNADLEYHALAQSASG